MLSKNVFKKILRICFCVIVFHDFSVVIKVSSFEDFFYLNQYSHIKIDQKTQQLKTFCTKNWPKKEISQICHLTNEYFN